MHPVQARGQPVRPELPFEGYPLCPLWCINFIRNVNEKVPTVCFSNSFWNGVDVPGHIGVHDDHLLAGCLSNGDVRQGWPSQNLGSVSKCASQLQMAQDKIWRFSLSQGWCGEPNHSGSHELHLSFMRLLWLFGLNNVRRCRARLHWGPFQSSFLVNIVSLCDFS